MFSLSSLKSYAVQQLAQFIPRAAQRVNGVGVVKPRGAAKAGFGGHRDAEQTLHRADEFKHVLLPDDSERKAKASCGVVVQLQLLECLELVRHFCAW